MAEDNKQIDARTNRISLRNLYLDPNNYRLIHEPEYSEVAEQNIKDKDVINRTYRLIIGEKNQNITDLVDSFKSNGYLPVDQIQVRALESGGFVVVEGNRRVAALKFLQNEYEQKSIDLGKLDKEIFSLVPIVRYENSDEVHHLTLMALKHISGNKKWGDWNQAKLLETLTRQYNVSEDDLCKKIAISKSELRRNIRALAFCNLYKQSDYGDQFTETMFPLFREVARNTALKSWLGWNDLTGQVMNTENLEEFFNFLSLDTVEREDEEEGSSIETTLEKAIVKRDDVVTFSKIIKDENALRALRESRNITEAYRASDIIFKEKLNYAITALASDISTIDQLSIPVEQMPLLEEQLGKLRTVVDKANSKISPYTVHDSVFFDKIDQHFSSVTIDAYRCFHNLTINRLARINVFAGINNSGKTSLLEAIYLLCKQNDISGLADILRRRGKIPSERISSKWFVEQISEPILVSGVFDTCESKVELRPYNVEDSSVDRSTYLKSIEILSSFGTHQQEALTQLHMGSERVTQAESIKLLCNTVFSSPFFLNEPHYYTGFYQKSVRSKALPKIFDFIREFVVPTIQDIRLVDDNQRFLVTDTCFGDAIDLSNYGEGLQRIFFTSLIFASAENGVVLIDEFENAIHTDLLSTFSKFICQLAKQFNVQVFLTSHSKECIDCFASLCNDSSASDFTFHSLVRHDGAILLREFDGNEFAKLVNSADVDLRRAK